MVRVIINLIWAITVLLGIAIMYEPERIVAKTEAAGCDSGANIQKEDWQKLKGPFEHAKL